MWKKWVIMTVGFVISCFQVTAAVAAHSDTGPGCGLGKVAWGDFKGQKQIAPQVMMWTTNLFFASGLFGISFGTSGCTNDGVIIRTERVNLFASSSFENLSQEMAQGHGEHLASLATLLGVPAEHQAEFFAMTQERYTTLMQAGDKSPITMLKALQDTMEAHPVLAKLSPTH